MREAARLQSFDDDFQFITSSERDDTTSIGVGMDMIGEAVPPVLAEAFARHIAVLLQQNEGEADERISAQREETQAAHYGMGQIH